MAETYYDTNGDERCDECGEELDYCSCTCDNCGDNIHECCCEESL